MMTRNWPALRERLALKMCGGMAPPGYHMMPGGRLMPGAVHGEGYGSEEKARPQPDLYGIVCQDPETGEVEETGEMTRDLRRAQMALLQARARFPHCRWQVVGLSLLPHALFDADGDGPVADLLEEEE